MLTVNMVTRALFDVLNNPNRYDWVLPEHMYVYNYVKDSLGTMVSNSMNLNNNSMVNRAIGFVTITGSHNYGLTTQNSDLDFKATYFPLMRDFYYGSFPTFNIGYSDFDCTLHSIHEFKKHMLKGNMNFFEPLFSDSIVFDHSLSRFMELMKLLVIGNIKETVYATWFTVRNKVKLIPKFKTEQHEQMGYNFKEGYHIIRLYTFLKNLIVDNNFDIRFNASTSKLLIDIKNGYISYKEYNEMYQDLYSMLTELLFVSYDEMSKELVLQNSVLEKDVTDTAYYNTLNFEADQELVTIIERKLK